MRPMLTLVRREFTAYFLSPIAYVVVAAFLGLVAYFLWRPGEFTQPPLTLLAEKGPRGIEYPMQGLLGNSYFWLVFVLIPAVLTMRLFAEERGTGTLEMLLTAPIRDWQVVLAKYLACLGFYVVLWLPTLAFVPLLVNFDWQARTAGIDPYPVWTSYLGVFLVGAMFLALGLFVSSLVKSQLVAALIALALSVAFVLGPVLQSEVDPSSLDYRIMYFFSVPLHFSRDFTRGVIDTRHLVLYASVAVFCLFMTVRSLESRRWR